MPFNFFLSNDTPTTDIHSLSLHDALPILCAALLVVVQAQVPATVKNAAAEWPMYNRDLGGTRFSPDRKSTRLNSSHRCISYAVFCLKKKNKRTFVPACLGMSASVVHYSHI